MFRIPYGIVNDSGFQDLSGWSRFVAFFQLYNSFLTILELLGSFSKAALPRPGRPWPAWAGLGRGTGGEPTPVSNGGIGKGIHPPPGRTVHAESFIKSVNESLND